MASRSCVVATAIALASGGVAGAQCDPPPDPTLKQETLGTGVTDVANSRLDLQVRYTDEVDPADLDGDGDFDLVYCQFYLFNPPLDSAFTQEPYNAVKNTGGIRLLYNKTLTPGGQPEVVVGPPDPDPNDPTKKYHYMRGNLVDETAARLIWGNAGQYENTPPSVRDAEIADLDGDGDLDIVLAASVAVEPTEVILPDQQLMQLPEQSLAQNRILIQDHDTGVFSDETFGAEHLHGGTGDDADRLPLLASNTGGVAVGDLDRDGDLDIVFAEYGPYFEGAVNILLLNDGTGQVATWPPGPVGTGHFQPPPLPGGNPFAGQARASFDVEIADLDNDGKLDVVFANANPPVADGCVRKRDPVMNVMNETNWAFDAASAAKRQEEIWRNTTSVLGVVSFQFIEPPPAPGLPSSTASAPYNDPGFWSDTRSVCIGDIDGDGDQDILFGNSGWNSAEPDKLTNKVINGAPTISHFEHFGQVSQLLLNMGGFQDDQVPKTGGGNMRVGDFLDVGYYALPWNRSAHMHGTGKLNPDGTDDPQSDGSGVRVISDFELTTSGLLGTIAPAPHNGVSDTCPQHPGYTDVGSPGDLINTSPTPCPTRDPFPDLLVMRGAGSISTVYINSGDWHMVNVGNVNNANDWFTKGRFFSGDQHLRSTWADPSPLRPGKPGTKSIWDQQDTAPLNPFGFARFSMFDVGEMYSHDGDWVDIDNDGWLDVVTADGEPVHGQMNGVFLNRGLIRGLRWLGPSDEGALVPYDGAVLDYGVSSGDVDADGDEDIVVAGVPTALALRNDGSGVFEEHTFNDRNGGWLPFTGFAPLYGPLLTETVALVDAEGDGSALEMFFVGYPPYDSNGKPHNSQNEATNWHLPDPGYFDPVRDVNAWPTESAPLVPHTTFYVGPDPTTSGAGLKYLDRTLGTDPATGTLWLDRNGRTFENIGDEARAADIDNDGDQDVVVEYRNFNQPEIDPFYIDPDPTSTYDSQFDSAVNVALKFYNPSKHQVTLSLWMNDGLGHFKDEAVSRLGSAWIASGTTPGADNYFWDATAGDRYEGLAFADVDSDGDLDMLLSATPSGTTSPTRNRLFINMGGNQKSTGGGSYRAGQFRVAGLRFTIGPVTYGPLSWSGVFGPNLDLGTTELESADLNGDDAPDFMGAGFQTGAHGTIAGYLLMNDGSGVFSSSALGNVSLDDWMNHAPGGVDSVASVETGDFDCDGDMDVILITGNGNTPRYLENRLFHDGVSGAFSFVDRTSVDPSVIPPVEPAPEGISWLAGWGVDGSVADFDRDGVDDLFIANISRATQDELLISTTTPTHPTDPRITRVLPAPGQVTGRTLRIRGVHFANPTPVTTVWFKKVGGATVPVTGASVTVTDNEVTVPIPAGASLGLGRVSLGNSNAPVSNEYQYTHLNAGPAPSTFSTSTTFGFKASDADGFSQLVVSTWKIWRKRGTTTTLWSWDSPGVWSQTTPGLLKLTAANSVKLSGDDFTFEVGDNKAAYCTFKLHIP